MKRWVTLVVTATALALFAVPSALASPGDLDPSFGTHGVVTEDMGTTADRARDIVVQPDGRIVVAGGDDRGARIVRYLPDGTLDTSFGAGGKLLVRACQFTTMAMRPDGGLVIAGPKAVCVLTADGGPDTSFSGDGILPTDTAIADVAVGQSGSIYLLTGPPAPNFATSEDIVVIKLLPDGTPDPSFSGDGSVQTDVGGLDQSEQIVVEPDERVVVSAFVETNRAYIAFLRYSPDGTLDPSWSGDGIAQIPHDGPPSNVPIDLARTSDGRIVFLGSMAVSVFTATGTLDPAFGGGRAVGLPFEAESIAVQPDSKLVIAGDTRLSRDGPFASSVTRLNPDGAFDRTFSGDGTAYPRLVQGVSDFHQGADAVALQADGRILAAGSVNFSGNQDFVTARYQVDPGSPNADADSALDPDDRCPRLYALAATGCPLVVRTLSLQYVSDRDRFRSVLRAFDDGCTRSTRVSIFRVVPGKDQRIAAGITAESPRLEDVFSVRHPVEGGRYYAKARTEVLPDFGVCDGVRSPILAVAGGG
jgi:uncharacterized delta-60 repeat protein